MVLHSLNLNSKILVRYSYELLAGEKKFGKKFVEDESGEEQLPGQK